MSITSQFAGCFVLCSMLFIASPAVSAPLEGQIIDVEIIGSETIIEWNHFEITHPDIIIFEHTSSGSAVLNRILDNATQINSVLTANSSLFIINPSGIIFGSDPESLFTANLEIFDGQSLNVDNWLVFGEGDAQGLLEAWIGNGQLYSNSLSDLDAVYDPSVGYTQIVPEPASLLLLGLGGMLIRKRR